MTDKEILDEVYLRLKEKQWDYHSQIQGWLFGDPLIDFIEKERKASESQTLNENEWLDKHDVTSELGGV